MGITDAKQAAQGASVEAPSAAGTVEPNYYCLSKDHAARLVTRERFFRFDGEVNPPGHPRAGELVLVDQGPGMQPVPDTSKAPICPVCSAKGDAVDPLTGLSQVVRVSAIPLEYDDAGGPQIPQAILDIAQRAGEV